MIKMLTRVHFLFERVDATRIVLPGCFLVSGPCLSGANTEGGVVIAPLIMGIQSN